MNIKSVDTPSTCYVPVISKVERLLCTKSGSSAYTNQVMFFLDQGRG